MVFWPVESWLFEGFRLVDCSVLVVVDCSVSAGLAIAGRDSMIIRRDIRGSFVVKNTRFLAVSFFGY